MRWLLDANVLIAASDVEHVHHRLVGEWLSASPDMATCPVVEGVLVRYLVRMGVSHSAISASLSQLRSLPHHEFWPDDLRYSDIDLSRVIGHRQVTDAYLISLVRKKGKSAQLATLDAGIAALYPDVVLMIPEI